MRPRTAGTDNDVTKADALLEELLLQFLRARDIAQTSDGVRAAPRDDVGPPLFGAHTRGHGLHRLSHVGARRHHADAVDSEQTEQEIVPAGTRPIGARNALLDHEMTAQAFLHGSRERDSAMVRLGRTTGDEGIGADGECVAHQEFELAGLVAAGRETQHVVTLDPDPRPTERLREAGQEFERCCVWGVAAAREAGKIHAQNSRSALWPKRGCSAQAGFIAAGAWMPTLYSRPRSNGVPALTAPSGPR